MSAWVGTERDTLRSRLGARLLDIVIDEIALPDDTRADGMTVSRVGEPNGVHSTPRAAQYFIEVSDDMRVDSM